MNPQSFLATLTVLLQSFHRDAITNTSPDIAEYRLLTSRLAAARFHKLSEPGRLHAFVCTRFAET